jgi:hypothetical protein
VVKLRDIWQTLYPYGVFRTGKAVYLTFDDGPIPEVTPKVLAILEKYHIKATFFMVGENVDKHPEVYEQVVKAGHRIGNHTYNHLKGWRTSFRSIWRIQTAALTEYRIQIFSDRPMGKRLYVNA